jgi:hypothetical protein
MDELGSIVLVSPLSGVVHYDFLTPIPAHKSLMEVDTATVNPNPWRTRV